MRQLRNWLWLLLFGSLWGISEVIFGEVLARESIPYASVWLSAWALLVLGLARGVLNKAGTSTIIGAVAALFKLVNTAPFFCHLLGIFCLGLVFDIITSIVMKNERKVSYRASLSGILSAYGSFTLFALVMTYIIRYEFWVSGGLAKVMNHIFMSGSLTALTAVILVPLGFWAGIRGSTAGESRPRWACTGIFTVSVILWALGRIAG